MRRGLLASLRAAVALGAVLLIGCDTGGERTPTPDDAPVDRNEDQDVPLTGGPCSYERITFTATVDSVRGDGSLVVRPDSALVPGNWCGSVNEVGPGRWRVPAVGGSDRPERGDTVEVISEVIVTGTCVPCTVTTRRPAPGR